MKHSINVIPYLAAGTFTYFALRSAFKVKDHAKRAAGWWSIAGRADSLGVLGTVAGIVLIVIHRAGLGVLVIAGGFVILAVRNFALRKFVSHFDLGKTEHTAINAVRGQYGRASRSAMARAVRSGGRDG